MQLFKQLITKQYQKYIEHSFNNRFFPEEFYQAEMMASTILEKKDVEKTKLIQTLWKRTHKKAMNKAIEKTPRKKDEKDKEYKNRLIKEYTDQKNKYTTIFHKLILTDIKNINEYLNKYKHITIQEEPPQLTTHIKGIIGVIKPGYTYEKR